MLCKRDEESSHHLFFSFSISIRMHSRLACYEEEHGHKHLNPKSLYRGSSNVAKMRCTSLAACVYHIWMARNRALFEGENTRIEDIIRKIQILTLRCNPPIYGTLEIAH